MAVIATCTRLLPSMKAHHCSSKIKFMIRSFLLVMLLYLFMSGFHKPAPPRNFSIQLLAKGVWAAIHNDKSGHAISNAGIVDLGDKTLVFDAFINPDAALELRKVAEQLTGHPVSFVINSHFHDDHIRGDQVFVPTATIISTKWTRDEMEKVEPGERQWARKNIADEIEAAKRSLRSAKEEDRKEDVMWLGYYEAISQSLPTLRMILPGLTFQDSLWIHGSFRSVLLVEYHGGHTASDAVMIIPKDSIAFMGDLLFADRHPWFGDGIPDSLKKHLQGFYHNEALKQFIPGHGPVTGKKSMQRLIQYIDDLENAADDAVRKGLPDSLFEKTPVPAPYRDWWFGRFYTDNLAAVYQRAKEKVK